MQRRTGRARCGEGAGGAARGSAAAMVGLGLMVIVMGAGACGQRVRGSAAGGEGVGAGDATAAQVALLPTRMMIHPLTRIGADSRGRPALVLHFELRDRFDQNTRALGVLEVGVQQPGLDPLTAGGGSGGPGEGSLGEATWRVDLGEAERNALLFDDLVTRTYVITLTDLPEWLVAWSERRPRVALGLGSPTVSARFTFADPREPGVGRVVADSARIAR